MSLTLIDKLFKSALGAGIMMAVANPLTYSFVENVVSGKGDIANLNGCPTVLGHIIHTVVFLILIVTLMIVLNYGRPDDIRKSLWTVFKYSFFSAVIFFALTSTEAYQFTNNLTGGLTADLTGCATQSGVLLHSFVYFVIIFALMLFPREC